MMENVKEVFQNVVSTVFEWAAVGWFIMIIAGGMHDALGINPFGFWHGFLVAMVLWTIVNVNAKRQIED